MHHLFMVLWIRHPKLSLCPSSFIPHMPSTSPLSCLPLAITTLLSISMRFFSLFLFPFLLNRSTHPPLTQYSNKIFYCKVFCTKALVLNQEQFCPPPQGHIIMSRDILVVITRGKFATSIQWVQEKVLSILQCIGHPTTTKNCPDQMLIMLELRNPGYSNDYTTIQSSTNIINNVPPS